MVFMLLIRYIWVLLSITFFYVLKLSVAPIWWTIKSMFAQFEYVITDLYKDDKSLNRKEILLIFNRIKLDVFTKIKKDYNEINELTNKIHEAVIDVNNYLNEVGWFLLVEWIDNMELKIKNKINGIISAILNKENHSITVILNKSYKKFSSLSTKNKIIIIYLLYLWIIRGATLSELPSYSILFILSKFNPEIKLKVSKADIIWWKIKCFFIRNFTDMKEPENPDEIRKKEIMESMNKYKRPSDLEQRELDRLDMENSKKLNNETITFIDEPTQPVIEQKSNIIKLTEEERRHKANEIESIVHQMFGKENSNHIKPPIIKEDDLYEKFKWIFDLFDFF